MKRKRDPLLDPLPKWEQRRRALVAWWRRSRDSRRNAYRNLKKAGRKGLTLAISVVGATLVSFGVWSVYAPAGYITAGALLWAIQWNYGEEGDG
jgi:hypothetical protein